MLTAKQETFKNRIIAGDSPIDAARVAYPNIKTDTALSTMAHENMMKHDIKEAIDDKRAELSAKVGNNRADILKETMRIAYALNSSTVSTGDKLRALELCGKECEGGIWTDKLAGAGKGEEPDQLSAEDLATLRTMAKAVTDRGLKGPVLAQEPRKAETG